MRKILILFFILVFLIQTACIGVSQEVAEAKALRFVKERVKFYTTENNSDLDFPSYMFNSIDSYKEKGNWIIIIQVSTTKNESKKTEVVVEINSKNGKITKLNGQPVNYQ